MTPWAKAEAIVDRYDADVRVEVGSGAAWSATLRLTLTNPDGAPSRSMAFYAVGGATADDALGRAVDDVEAWMAEGDAEPLPVPEWLRS